MTLEFKKGKKQKQDVCFISTEKIENPEFPIWITQRNFHKIRKLMKW